MKLYSQEHFDEVKRRMNTDKEYQEKTKGFNLKWVVVVTDCPGGVDKLTTWDIKDGKCIDVKLLESPAPSEWRKEIPNRQDYLGVVTGSYEVNARMNRKEMTSMQAMAQKVYKIDAPMVKVMAMMGKMQAWLDMIASVPVEY